LIKAFEAEGFRCVRTEGDHVVLHEQPQDRWRFACVRREYRWKSEIQEATAQLSRHSRRRN